MKFPCKYNHLANLNLCAFTHLNPPTFALLPRHFSLGKTNWPKKGSWQRGPNLSSTAQCQELMLFMPETQSPPLSIIGADLVHFIAGRVTWNIFKHNNIIFIVTFRFYFICCICFYCLLLY